MNQVINSLLALQSMEKQGRVDCWNTLARHIAEGQRPKQLEEENVRLRRVVAELCQTMEHRVSAMRRVVVKPGCPEVPIGINRDTPYHCLLQRRCWAGLPEHNVMELYRGKAKGFALLGREVRRITEVSEGIARLRSISVFRSRILGQIMPSNRTPGRYMG